MASKTLAGWEKYIHMQIDFREAEMLEPLSDKEKFYMISAFYAGWNSRGDE